MPVIKTGIFIKATSLITKVYTSISSKLASTGILTYAKNTYIAKLQIYNIIVYMLCILCFLYKEFWRKVRDSNSRCYISSTRPQQGRAFSHSANLPKRWFLRNCLIGKPATISLHHNVSKPGMIRIANVCNQRNQLPVGVILLDAYTVSCTYI